MKLRLAAIVLLLASSMHATQVRFSDTRKGRFVVTPEYTRAGIWQLTPTEKAKSAALFRKAHAILLADPLLTQPAGFSVYFHRGWSEPSSWNRILCTPFPGYSVQYWMQTAISPLLIREGRVADSEDSTFSLLMTANSAREVYRHYQLGDKGLQDRHDNEIFLEPKLISGFGKVKRYDNNLVIVHGKNASLWIPVSRGEYLQALIDKYDPARKGRDANEYMADFFRKELAALPQANRRSPARHSIGSESPSGLVAAGGKALVRVNPIFFDKRQPRAAVQLIVLRFWYHIPSNRMEAAAHSFNHGGAAWVMLQLRKRFAIEKLTALLD